MKRIHEGNSIESNVYDSYRKIGPADIGQLIAWRMIRPGDDPGSDLAILPEPIRPSPDDHSVKPHDILIGV